MRASLPVACLSLVFFGIALSCGSKRITGEEDAGADGGFNTGMTCDACACQPNSNVCVGNEVHACDATGNPGPLVMQCDVGKGEVCSNGSCKPGCIAAEEQPSNVGCEFWAVDLDNEYSQFNDAAGAPWGIVLSNAGQAMAQVTIEKNDAPQGMPAQISMVQTFQIPAGQLKKVILPTREVDGSIKGMDDGPGTWLSSNAYRITSSVPLVAYQFNTMEQSYSNDASLLLPRNALGTIHRVLGWPTTNPIAPIPTPGIPDHSFVTIVGVTASTNVTVTLGGDVVAGGTIKATKKGGTITATLGPFDVLNLESDGIPGDLTGTIVESTSPVAVFTGGERGIAPYDTPNLPQPPNYDPKSLCCTDHLEEQLLPVTSMGKTFVIARSPVRSNGWVEPDIIRFMGVAQTAQVATNLPSPDDSFSLAPGQMRETWTTKDFVVQSTQPIMVAQILVSQGYTYNWSVGGDPSLTIFPPIDQYRADYLFLVPPSWAKNYVTLSVPQGGTLTIDGQPLPSCEMQTAGPLGMTSWNALRCPVTEGAHRIHGTKAFGVVAYGYGPVGSYAFVGGADVKKIYTPPPLH